MQTNRLSRRAAHLLKRSGFTLVELLVVIGIIAILAGVALGPLTKALQQARHNTAMQLARQVGQVCFSFATDNTVNGNIYPAGTTSEAIANQLISANYVNDPSVFCVSGAVGGQKVYGGAQPVVLAQNNITWNFTCLSLVTTGGVTSNTSDLIPLIYLSGQTVTYPVTAGTATDLTLSGTTSAFGTDGIAVFYKGNNAAYLKAGTITAGKVTAFISANCADTTTYQTAIP